MKITEKQALSNVRKAVVAVAGFVAEGLATGLIHGTAEHYAQGVLAVLTAIGVYVVPNTVAAASVPVAQPAVPPTGLGQAVTVGELVAALLDVDLDTPVVMAWPYGQRVKADMFISSDDGTVVFVPKAETAP